jgi:WD40 repeat protein
MCRSVSLLLLFALPAMEQRAVPPVPPYWAEHIRHSPDGRLLAVARFPQGYQLWDVNTGRLLNAVPGLFVQGIAWSPDGKRVALATKEKPGAANPRLEIWNPQGSAALQTFPNMSEDSYFDPQPEWSPDGKQIAVRSARGAHVLNLASGNWTPISEPGTSGDKPSRYAGSFCWMPDSRRLALVAGDRETDDVDIWNVATPAIERTVAVWHKSPGDLDNTPQSSKVAWSANGREFAVCSRFLTISILDARTGQLAFRSIEKSVVDFLSWSADSRYLQVGTFYQVRFLHAKDGSLGFVLEDMGRAFHRISVASGSNEAAGAEIDATVVLWRGHGDLPSTRMAPDGSGNWQSAHPAKTPVTHQQD